MNKLVEAIEAALKGRPLHHARWQMIEATIDELNGRHGWKLVPVEPTEAMLEASSLPYEMQKDGLETYRAMLAASPDPMSD